MNGWQMVSSLFASASVRFGTLPTILAPLEAHKQRLLVLKGVHMNSTVEDELGKAGANKPGGSLFPTLGSTNLGWVGSTNGPAEQWPAGVRGAASKVKSLLYGFITCDGVNYAQVAFASPSKA